MLASLSRPRLRLPLERHIRITRDPLPQIIKAMHRVVRDFFIQLDAVIALLEVLYYVGETMELVEDGHHVAFAVVPTVEGDVVGGGEVVGAGGGGDDVTSGGWGGLVV